MSIVDVNGGWCFGCCPAINNRRRRVTKPAAAPDCYLLRRASTPALLLSKPIEAIFINPEHSDIVVLCLLRQDNGFHDYSMTSMTDPRPK